MEGNSIVTFENLCKIFEMRIKLDREKGQHTSDDVINSYEKYAKKIDLIYNDEFRDKVLPLIMPSKTLEEEQERLKKLISLLEDRLRKRKKLEDRFYEATGMIIKGLQPVVSEDEFKEKQERLDTISSYLEATSEISSLRDSISEMKKDLEEEERKKDEYLLKNAILEDELLTTFMDAIRSDDYYHDLSEELVDKLLEDISDKVMEARETLEVTKDSVDSLALNGAEDDYSSYVEEAEKSYYMWKNRELMLLIYRIVIQKEETFNEIYSKREKIFNILEERKKLRVNLKIMTIDELLEFEKVLLEEKATLDNERSILENITNYTSRITFKEGRLRELEDSNKRTEVLAILNEYGIIETYTLENEPDQAKDEGAMTEFIEDSTLAEESPINEVIDPYRIVEVKDYPVTLNLGLAKVKGESIREQVQKKLNSEADSNEEISMPRNIEVETMPDKINDPKPFVWELPTDVNGHLSPENNGSSFSLQDSDVQLEDSTIAINQPSIQTANSNIDFGDNPFWIPSSNEKLETGAFPNINIPIQDNSNTDTNSFSFPTFPNE